MAASIRLVFLFILAVSWPTQAQDRIGCFSFNHDSTVLSVKTHDVGSMDECIQLCKKGKATYAGVRYAANCYCGDSHNHTVNGPQLGDRSCNNLCNNHEPCGGQMAIVIYSVCSRGHYRNNSIQESNCDALCNCKNNSICMSNGSCPSECEPGWSGAACNITVVSSTPDVLTLITNDVTDPDRTRVGGADLSPNDANGLPVIGIAVGISLAALVLVVVAALYFVYFRRRRSNRQSHGGDCETKSIPAKDNSTQAKVDPSMKQAVSGPTTTSSTAPPMLNYSTVDFSNKGPVHVDGEDVSKSDDDDVIHGQHEEVEYAVVRKPADTTHTNLKDNSLYGAYNGDSDEEKVE